MARKRKSKKSSKTIALNKYKISILLLIIWVLFFFAKITAADSILFTLYSAPADLLFGSFWSTIFFWGLVWLWILILFREDLLRKWIFKKFWIFIIIFGTILNFPILDGTATDPQKLWWWISYILLRAADFMLGSQTFAIKSFFIWLLVWVVVWIWYTLNIKIKAPNIKFELNETEEKVEKEKKSKEDIKSKIPTFNASTKQDKDEPKKLFDENNEVSKDLQKSTLKSLLKEKITKKIDENENKKVIEKIVLNFPAEKPTFNKEMLESWDWQSYLQVDEQYLIDKAQALKNKLQEFDISVEIDGFNIWPSVIQIKIVPDAWIKISKIEWLKNDLSLALKTKSLRVLAPIPGTDTVWIEVPNPKSSMIRIKEILWSKEFNTQMASNFTNLWLGIAIDGKTIVKSLEKMPHLLVAWATGTGKSVWINNFILSLLYQNTPAEMRLIMVDPKQVEFALYEWIPYLLSPIITEPEKAIKVLKWATAHMDERYWKLKEAKVRNIDEYNEKCTPEDKMYRIVIIIDELADLMMTWNRKDTESCIARIAQKARAVWMHLILATQRPSVNVITWIIKANIPTRVAFTVVSQIDSRTILDMKWAEDLLGKWDMLYVDPTSKFPLRIQCPFVSTEETNSVIEEIKSKYMMWIEESQIYHPEIINILTAKAETAWWGWEVSEDDEWLVENAIEIIAETRKASATLLQRKLGIWFARAARIMDILEDRWIVWPQDWAKPRDILI